MSKTLAFLAACLAAAVFVVPRPAQSAVTVGGLRYSIQDVHVASSVGSDDDGTAQHANGEYIVLRLKVTNVGDKPASISASDFHLRSGSTEFDAASESLSMQDEFFLTTLNPGTSHAGTILFDVPAHTSPAKYQLEVYGNGGTDPMYIPL